MSTDNRKELMNEAFDSVLVTSGVVGLSMVSKKLLDQKLTKASNIRDIAKLSVGVLGANMLVKYAQSKNWIPTDPFKTS